MSDVEWAFGGEVRPPALSPERETVEPKPAGEKREKIVPLRAGNGPHNDWRDELIMKITKLGRVPDDVPANAIVALRYHPAWRGVVAFDEFRQSIVTLKSPPWGPNEAPPSIKLGTWTDGDSVRLQAWLRRDPFLGLKLGRDAIDAALIVASEGAPIDPPRAYLEGLTWDAKRRVGENPSELNPTGAPSWLTTYLGVHDTPYTRWVGRWFLIASVARIFRPGCKFDYALVLEGGQGRGKSTATKILYDPWYSDTPIDLQSKDRFGAIQGIWGYELAEFDGYSKHDQATLKQFASSPKDRYRPPYMRRDVEAPRRCVFIPTINPAHEYLHDETGGRRWWPVRVGRIDLDALARDKDLLWAEARELYSCHERYYPYTPSENAACQQEQSDRQSRDAWEDPIRAWLVSKMGDVTIGDVLGAALQLEKAKWGKQEQMRAGACLRACGYERRRVREEGSREYVYRKRDADEPNIS